MCIGQQHSSNHKVSVKNEILYFPLLVGSEMGKGLMLSHNMTERQKDCQGLTKEKRTAQSALIVS